MKEIQLNIPKKEITSAHKNEISSLVERLRGILPEFTIVRGYFKKSAGSFEGKIKVRTRIGVFFAKAKDQELQTLISILQAKILRQTVNWKERRTSKKRYLRRKHLRVVATTE